MALAALGYSDFSLFARVKEGDLFFLSNKFVGLFLSKRLPSNPYQTIQIRGFRNVSTTSADFLKIFDKRMKKKMQNILANKFLVCLFAFFQWFSNHHQIWRLDNSCLFSLLKN
jgi:hypothetical protein